MRFRSVLRERTVDNQIPSRQVIYQQIYLYSQLRKIVTHTHTGAREFVADVGDQCRQHGRSESCRSFRKKHFKTTSFFDTYRNDYNNRKQTTGSGSCRFEQRELR